MPLQVHGMDVDPFFAGEDLDAARDLVGSAADAELVLYPGARHLFTDDSVSDHDHAASTLLTQRVLALVSRAG